MKKPVNYFFRWQGGGYNSVKATSKKEALRKATEMVLALLEMVITLIGAVIALIFGFFSAILK